MKNSERIGLVFIIKYFCCLHTQNLDESLASPSVGPMASLVRQLLNQILSRELDVNPPFLEKSD
jgi:hypothetical protein